MGRPPFEDPAQVRSERLTITLTAREKAALAEGASDQDLTASTLARDAVLTHPAVVQHLEIRDDYRALRRLARDWLDRTEQMVGYFEDYMEPKEAAEFSVLIEEMRRRVAWFDDVMPLPEED
jgi:hypothetical protein